MKAGVRWASPFGLCATVWTIVLVCFYWGPFIFEPLPSPQTLFVLMIFLLLFVGASMGGYASAHATSGRATRISSVSYAVLDLKRIINVLSTAALLGTACIVVDRIVSQGFSGLAGFTELRYERAEDLLFASDISRGVLTYAGYILYPAMYLVVAIGVCYYEALGHWSKLLLSLNMICPFVLAVFFGGRSPILVLFLIIISSMISRRQLALRGIPSGAGLKLLAIVGVVAFFIYTNIIWFQRLELSSSSVEFLLSHAESIWGIAPTPGLERSLANIGRPDAVVPLLGAWFYLFQGPTIFERLLASNPFPVLFGGYHIDVVAAAFRMYSPTRVMLSDGYGRLLAANVYGFFPTAWGSLLIDFSAFAYPMVAVWGWTSGSVFARLRNRGSAADAVFYIFLFYSILISPISAPFGLANSFLIFLYFLAFKLWAARALRPRPRT